MSDNNEMNAVVQLDNDKVTLADIAGLSMDDVQEKRIEALPRMHGLFEVMSDPVPSLQKIGEGDTAKAGAVFSFKVLDVSAVSDDDYKGTKDELIGKTHRETFFISDLDSLGYLKAFVVDIGGKGVGNVSDMLRNCAGLRFNAFIGKRKDKNDADKIYTNFVRGKGKITAAGGGAGEIAKAVAA